MRVTHAAAHCRRALLAFQALLLARDALGEPLLDVMYLKYGNEPIDTNPVFNPMISMYKATLDWKMKFFAVEAKPVGRAIIDNIHLCRHDGDCLKEDQRVVPMDFSKKIQVEPGGKILYMFDVLLEGIVKSYTLIVRRLEGSETTIRRMFIQGVTLWPDFHPNTFYYRALMEVEMEMVQMELHLADSGQTVFADADYPVPLNEHDNITELQNSHPGNTRSPPQRLRRRMREEAFGEFQYPNKYFDFPVPLESTRIVHFKVISADGGHYGYYQLETGRGKCPTSEPLFDIDVLKCVKFCNAGFYGDYEASRCKRCQESCVNCLSLPVCVQCAKPNRRFYYELDNVTQSCVAKERALWVQHPQHVIALAIGACSCLVFCCGLCAFCQLAGQDKKDKRNGGLGARAPGGRQERGGQQPYGGYAAVDNDDYEEDTYRGF